MQTIIEFQEIIDQLRAELAAVDAALGELCVLGLKDHGVDVVVERLALAHAELDRVNGELAARDRALYLAANELVHQQDEVARLRKGAGCGTQKANVVEDAR